MSENKLILSGVCPYCPAVLDYPEDAKAVMCHSCGNAVPTSILRPLNYAQNKNTANEKDKRIADGVTSSAAGLIYFDNFCESYDWKSFALNSDLSISTLDAISEACKIKFSADPLTYYLDFRCVAIPILKKIDGLDVIELEIIDNYQSDDISDLFSYVDLYSTITHQIVEKRDALIKTLSTDIMLAKRFYADELIVADLEKSFEVFVEKISAVSAASSVEDVPGYQKAKELKDARLAEKIRAKGFDAEKTYRKAMILLNGGNVDNALHLFVAINGYKDSTERIADHSRIFKFNNELVEMAKRYYCVQTTTSYDNVKDMTLYSIENGVPTGVPALTQITDVIHSFGNRIFYIRNNSSICCYDTSVTDFRRNVKVLDEGNVGDYAMTYNVIDGYSGNAPRYEELSEIYGKRRRTLDKTKRSLEKRLPMLESYEEAKSGNRLELNDVYEIVEEYDVPEKYLFRGFKTKEYRSPVYYSSDMSKFFIRKKLPEEETVKRGCFGREKKPKNVSEAIARGNNYSVLLVDMDNAVASTILPEIVDILYYHNDRIFYTSVPEGSRNCNPSFYMYDIATGNNTQLLNPGCIIHEVNDGYVIYSVTMPNKHNTNLYTTNIESKTHTLISENVSGFYASYGNRVFYTVGTGKDARLYSTTNDGKTSVEILENPGDIKDGKCIIRSGWLYYVSGEGINTCLMKVRVTGSERVLVASRFSNLVKMVNGYIFYISTSGDLRTVRSDGNVDTRIACNVAGTQVIIDENSVYYLKHDFVGVDDLHEDGFGLSLYSTDHSGKNLRKIAHDVMAIREYNDRYIYIRKQRLNNYKITTPIDKRTDRTELVSISLTYYEAYDKQTNSFTDIVHFGTPTPTSIIYKKSWWPFSKKTVTKRGSVTEMRSVYKPENVADVGMMRDATAHKDVDKWTLDDAWRELDIKMAKQHKEEEHTYLSSKLTDFAVQWEADKKAREEAPERIRREAEEAQARREAEEKARRDAEEKARREAKAHDTAKALADKIAEMLLSQPNSTTENNNTQNTNTTANNSDYQDFNSDTDDL
ncbi:MAG: DUF5050 domain-containing protein [Ruminococcaceae bacterium]|nr:DUF5050 domain-containing protein [Oscillospiraceae bacterium]